MNEILSHINEIFSKKVSPYLIFQLPESNIATAGQTGENEMFAW